MGSLLLDPDMHVVHAAALALRVAGSVGDRAGAVLPFPQRRGAAAVETDRIVKPQFLHGHVKLPVVHAGVDARAAVHADQLDGRAGLIGSDAGGRHERRVVHRIPVAAVQEAVHAGVVHDNLFGDAADRHVGVDPDSVAHLERRSQRRSLFARHLKHPVGLFAHERHLDRGSVAAVHDRRDRRVEPAVVDGHLLRAAAHDEERIAAHRIVDARMRLLSEARSIEIGVVTVGVVEPDDRIVHRVVFVVRIVHLEIAREAAVVEADGTVLEEGEAGTVVRRPVRRIRCGIRAGNRRAN